ncbi:MAG: single-stranded-DNA-specific exonuclease RecJ [Chloroflexi bacterium]|nr:single-stranded-DNA-specific exonuclease RecJ [Chloroflexota bacterium]
MVRTDNRLEEGVMRLCGEKIWLEPTDTPLPEGFRDSIGGHPLVAQTLARRGVTDLDAARAFLDPDYYSPTPASQLPGLTRAADLIERAIKAGENILVWGDFDVDGQTATTLLVVSLRDLGAEVSFHIPIRSTEGHGIQVEKLADLLTPTPLTPNSLPPNRLTPTLLLTCDTGIAAHEAVEYARARGLTVIITDHHDLPPTLPAADAIVNPRLLPESHPLSTLPGVGVAYKLVEELYDRLSFDTAQDKSHTTDRGQPSAIGSRYLDLVALGIVADVALQTGEARYLLQRGLEVLRRTQRLGLQILFETAGLTPDQLTEDSIGFSIAPRLNALGRLSDANPIVEFLTTDDPIRAHVIAAQLEGLNEKRRLLTDQIYQAALSQIEREPELLNFAALVLAHPQWPAGVIGLVASRLVERFGRPAILLSAPEGQPAHGSARSVEGVHITEAIAAQSDMLLGYGGHPMAAGLSIAPERIPDFRQALSRTIRAAAKDTPLQQTRSIAAYLSLPALTLDFLEDLERLAPFGAGNPPLTLACRDLKLVSHTPMGRANQHLRLVVEDPDGNSQEILWWRGAGEELPQSTFDLAFHARANTFRGERRIQAELLDYRPSAAATLEVVPEPPALEAVDYRGERHPLPLLDQLKTQDDILLYTEGEAKRRLGGRDRLGLVHAPKLILWTPPPGPRELRVLLEAVSPQVVYLFAVAPGVARPEEFLKRLAGLVKHTLKARDGIARLDELAAAMAHRETTVRLGLAWLEEKGHISVERGEGGELRLRTPGQPGHALDDVAMTLEALLDETAAYREYFEKANPATLLT